MLPKTTELAKLFHEVDNFAIGTKSDVEIGFHTNGKIILRIHCLEADMKQTLRFATVAQALAFFD